MQTSLLTKAIFKLYFYSIFVRPDYAWICHEVLQLYNKAALFAKYIF